MNNNLDSLEHVCINVHDIEHALRWYQTSFSCRLIYSDETRAILQFENIKLELVLPSQLQWHLAFNRADAASLGELRLQSDGSRSTFISDCSGNVLEILSPSQKL